MPAIPIAIYGDSGVGKTACVSQCFRNAFWLLYDCDGLATCRSLWGYMPRHIEMNNLEAPGEEARQVIRNLWPHVKKGTITSVVIDTGSELASRIFTVMDNRYNGNAMQVYPAAKQDFAGVIREVLNMKIPVVVIFQEAEPRERNAKVGIGEKLGGPALPGSTTREVRPMFSMILRAAMVPGEGGRQRVLMCDQYDDKWVMKDRYNVCQTVQPLDIRPIMQRVFEAEGKKR